MADISNYLIHQFISEISCTLPWLEYSVMIILAIYHSLERFQLIEMCLIILTWFLAEWCADSSNKLIWHSCLKSPKLVNKYLILRGLNHVLNAFQQLLTTIGTDKIKAYFLCQCCMPTNLFVTIILHFPPQRSLLQIEINYYY